MTLVSTLSDIWHRFRGELFPALDQAAELHGMPGPAHLVELKNEVPLTADQVPAVTDGFDEMRAGASADGTRHIAGE